ncbi:MAG: OmpH family outer membrane protein [Chitinophagia bacterium]|nr:OmpH family outer membrane protein [Chitinophagia bacterium]
MIKYISLILSIVSVIGVGYLCMKQAPASSGATIASNGGMKVAFVNIDTLEAHYEFLKSKREEFKKKQEVMENELEKAYQQMKQKGRAIEEKVNAQSITQSEYQVAERELLLMQQSLETRKNELTETLMKEQENLNKEIKSKLNGYLETYNKDKKFDYIVSFSAAGGSPFMYADKKWDITQEVIKGLNSATKSK